MRAEVARLSSRLTMAALAIKRISQVFIGRSEALGHFFANAGEAPRFVAYDEEIGCPLHNSLAMLEWAGVVGVLHDSDLIHAARMAGETAAAVVERKREGKAAFVYVGPRMDAPPADPYEGSLLYDEPGVRAFEFAQRVHAVAHFLRATHGVGSIISMLSRRAPELIHVKRWLAPLFEEPRDGLSSNLIAGWFATSGAGFLFAPSAAGEPYSYEELGSNGT